MVRNQEKTFEARTIVPPSKCVKITQTKNSAMLEFGIEKDKRRLIVMDPRENPLAYRLARRLGYQDA